jgi:hypothetical protein
MRVHNYDIRARAKTNPQLTDACFNGSWNMDCVEMLLVVSLVRQECEAREAPARDMVLTKCNK